MKLAVAVPVHKQSWLWPEILSALENQSILPEVLIPALDRASAAEVQAIHRAVEGSRLRSSILPMRPEAPSRTERRVLGREPFLAGHVRNAAMALAFTTRADAVVLIDGDCVPGPRLVEHHARLLASSRPCLTIGPKVHDPAGSAGGSSTMAPHPGEGWRRLTKSDLRRRDLINASNLGLNRAAMTALQDVNLRFRGRAEWFSSEFDGAWGGEDIFLAAQAMSLGVAVVRIQDASAAARHRPHPYHETASFLAAHRHLEEVLSDFERFMGSTGARPPAAAGE
jgi:hypothetical protein